MKDERIENDFYKQVEILFKDHPVNWSEFQELWNTGDLRLAYLYVKSCVKNLHLENTIAESVDSEFYWYIW